MNGADVVERALGIVEDALEIDVAERRAYVEKRCGHDPRLRGEVDALFAHAGGVEIAAALPVGLPPDVPARYDGEDRYELHEEIAHGAMGRIIRATDRDLGREVALKVLPKPGPNDAEVLRRFLAEARIAAWLQHPGVPAVHEVGRLADGRPFLAMKLVSGRTLGAALADREGRHRADPATDPAADPANLSPLLPIFERVCQTMARAHASGVIHRDLKPDNIMIGTFGEVQVMDWGLATTVAPPDAADAPAAGPGPIEPGPGTAPPNGAGLAGSNPFETRVGRAMGTPAYMAPEQIEGRRGTQGDVFALGAILCEILTGAPPYTGEPGDALTKSVYADLENAMTRLKACGAADELVRLARRCLEFDPERRPTDARDVEQAIRSYQGSVAERAHAAELAMVRANETSRQERRRRRLVLAVAGAIVGGLIITIGLMASHDRRMHAAAESMRLTHAAAALPRRDRRAQAQVIPLLEEAIRIDPSNAIAFATLSGTYLRLNRWDEAMAVAERAIELDGHYGACYNLANMLNARGQPFRAAHMADAGLAGDPEPDGELALIFRFRSAFFRIDAALGGDTTIGALEDEQVEELLRQALAPMRTNLEYLSSADDNWPVERVLRQTFVTTIANGKYHWPGDPGYNRIMGSDWRADPRYTRIRDPEVLRGLSPDLREAWEQVGADLDALLAGSTRTHQ